MAKKLSILTLLFSYFSCLGQPYIEPFLLGLRSSISPSLNIYDSRAFAYLHGNMEIYIQPTNSVLSDIYYYLGELNSEVGSFAFNHALFVGGAYHFVLNNNDLFLALQSGISYTKVNPIVFGLSSSQSGINPLFSTTIGYNLYFHKFFHFFAHVKLIFGEHNFNIPIKFWDIRLSAGLGFNLNIKSPKNKPDKT